MLIIRLKFTYTENKMQIGEVDMKDGRDFFIKWSFIGLFSVGVSALAFVIFKFVTPIILPFAIAYLSALAVRRPAAALSRRTKLHERAARIILILFFLLSFGVIVFEICQRMFFEAAEVLDYLSTSDVIERYVGYVSSFLSKIENRFPKIKGDGAGLADSISQNLLSGLLSSVSAMSAKLPAILGRIAASVPEAFFSAVLTVLAAFYFCSEPDILSRAAKKILPREARVKLSRLGHALADGARCYLRGYGVILLVTFSELFLAFTLLKVRYSFILALVISLLDLLPVIGVGTVLIPWSLIALIQGNTVLGVSLIVLVTAETIIRQLIEPKIIGRSVDLHPLIMLFSVYAGSKIFGVWGLITGPLIAIAIKTAYPVLFPSKEEDRADVK